MKQVFLGAYPSAAASSRKWSVDMASPPAAVDSRRRNLANRAEARGASRAAQRQTSVEPDDGNENSWGFALLCVFIASNLIHLTARVPVLGALRFDLLLAVATFGVMLAGKERRVSSNSNASLYWLATILGYIVITLPFVAWPGSVLREGLEPFLKSIAYYFLVTGLVTTERRLRIFLAVFLGCSLFRVFEPFYLHITEGYWGGHTSMTSDGSEMMARLSGAPDDVIGSNGLAQVILITTALLYYLVWPGRTIQKMLFLALGSVMSYILLLTASRSGTIVFVMLIGYVAWQSKYRSVAISFVVGGSLVLWGMLSDLMKQRYLSIFFSDVKGAATAAGRVEGVRADFFVALERPLFGHGLGTSLEANTHVRGYYQLSHNLYTEVAQELGFVGLALFLMFILSAVRNCLAAQAATRGRLGNSYLSNVSQALMAVILVMLVFSMASYGLSEYQWYLLAGLSVVILRLSASRGNEGSEAVAGPPGRAPVARPRSAFGRFRPSRR